MVGLPEGTRTPSRAVFTAPILHGPALDARGRGGHYRGTMSARMTSELAQSVIPVIDLGPCLAGRPGAREDAAAALRRALEDVGFLVLVNHGVPQRLID